MNMPHILAIHYKPSKILEPEEADTCLEIISLCLCVSDAALLIICIIPVSVQTPNELF